MDGKWPPAASFRNFANKYSIWNRQAPLTRMLINDRTLLIFDTRCFHLYCHCSTSLNCFLQNTQMLGTNTIICSSSNVVSFVLFHLLAFALSEPDTHVHVHLPSEDGKGNESEHWPINFKPYLNNVFHNNWGYCNGIDNAHLKSFFSVDIIIV